MDKNKIKTLAEAVLDVEAEAITALKQRIDDDFFTACGHMLACEGRIVVTGMGKSGHIGSKIAATLASTGTPAFFVHPGEASHGDLGMIKPEDVVLALSNSGETNEVNLILPLLKRLGVKIVAMTGNPGSTLARHADAHIDVSVSREACPLGLAPTSSTTAALVMGDALAIALLEARGFTAEDFALSHPGGSLGRRLLLHVHDIMHSGDQLPVVKEDTSLREALLVMSGKGLGMTAVVNANQQLVGIYTDGDLRRTLEQGVDVYSASIHEVMTANPVTTHEDRLAAEAVQLMRDKKINGLFVVDENNHVLGALNMQDLLREGVV